MRYKVLFVLVASVLALLPVSAQAQDEKKVHFTFGGGFTIPNSDVRDHLGDGYNVNFGLSVNVTPIIAIEGLYSFNGLGEKQVQLPAGVPLPPNPPGEIAEGPFFADMNMQYGDFNLVIKPPTEGKVRPYLVTGVGVYHRPVKVTTPSVGYVPGYCDPWWYVCYPGGWVPVDAIVGERSSTDFGMNLGGGVNFQLGESAAVFVEARYHYIWGPTIEGDPENRKANGQFLPITFGVRF